MKLVKSKKGKSFLFFLLLCSVSFILSACWSAKELHNLAIINAMGIDLNDKGDYEVTVVIPKPSALFSQPFVGDIGGDRRNNYLIETASGKTIFEAMGNLSKSIVENIYFGHVDVVVFGEKVAKEKMESSLDFFHRNIQFRPNTQLLVSKEKASDVVSISPEYNTTFGLEILDLIKSNRLTTTKMIRDMSQFKKEFNQDTTDPITAVVTNAENIGNKVIDEDANSKKEQEKRTDIVSLNGTAVFKEENLKGYLNHSETRGLLWIKGELKKEIVVLECGENEKGFVSVIINDSSSKMIPEINQIYNKITVITNVDARIGEVTCTNLKLNSNQLNQLNKQMEELIVKEEKDVLNKVQKQWQADIFGFGKAFYQKHPRDWDRIASNWRKGGLKDLQVHLKVNANISQYGLRKSTGQANESR